MDIQNEIQLRKAIQQYLARYSDLPTISNLDEGSRQKVWPVLQTAIKRGKPLTDAEFFQAIGLEPPPQDALI